MFKTFERFVPHRRPVIVVIHVVLVTLAYMLAFLLRFEFDLSATQWEFFLATLPLLLAIRTSVFAWFHVHEGLWRYVSMQDILTMLKATTLSSLLFVFAARAIFGGVFPSSIFVLDWLLCLALVGGVRLALRSVRELNLTRREGRPRRTLIVGAGDAAEMLVREIERNPTLNYAILGLVDDDHRKRGRRVHGIEVLGTVDQLSAISSRLGIEQILIALPSVRGRPGRRIAEHCKESGLPFRT